MRITPGTVTTVHVPIDEIERRRALVEASHTAQGGPRWPVMAIGSDLSYADVTGMSIDEYLGDPLAHAEAQILGQKWMLENIDTDVHTLSVFPMPGGGFSCFGAPVTEQTHSRPYSLPWISTAEDLERLRKVDVSNTGNHAVMRAWQERFNEVAEQYPVRFDGGEVFYPLRGEFHAFVGGLADGLSVAVELMGTSEFFLRMYDDPPFVKELIDIVTDQIAAITRASCTAAGYAGETFISSDYSAMVPPDAFVEFGLPSLQRIKDALPGPMKWHTCQVPGAIADVVLDELGPETFSGFKAVSDVAGEMRVMREKAGGRAYLEPYLDGTVMLHQTEDEIYADARAGIELFAECGMFHLGAMACDGMPLERLPRLSAAKRASKDAAAGQ